MIKAEDLRGDEPFSLTETGAEGEPDTKTTIVISGRTPHQRRARGVNPKAGSGETTHEGRALSGEREFTTRAGILLVACATGEKDRGKGEVSPSDCQWREECAGEKQSARHRQGGDEQKGVGGRKPVPAQPVW
jgi:hypothetical protein